MDMGQMREPWIPRQGCLGASPEMGANIQGRGSPH